MTIAKTSDMHGIVEWHCYKPMLKKANAVLPGQSGQSRILEASHLREDLVNIFRLHIMVSLLPALHLSV